MTQAPRRDTIGQEGAPLIPAARRSGDTLLLSGVADVDEHLAIRHRDFEGQAQAVLTHIDQVLSQNGMAREHVIRVECFLTHAEDFAHWNRIWAAHFAVPRPSRTTVVAGTVIDGIRIELQVTASLAT